MKKLAKVILTSSLMFTSAFGIMTINSQSVDAKGVSSIKPYYTYNGFTKASSNFVLDKNFINALKYDNFKINGYKITKNSSSNSKEINKFDQTFFKANNKKAESVFFDLDRKSVSKMSILKTYGKPVVKPYNTSQGMSYDYKIGHKTIQFVIYNNYVVKAQVNS
ncbi:hypothetical protein RSA37_03165 [Mammaliicoccus sciuri]|uniref:immunodominant staphylococcal antigen IsaB family protein n=1 Tax=Mammaliicoccus sciuri TaxID=1296 RepID=UPI0007940393|nr:hypothetical protein [Mammaliicoccus sciuri]KTT85201.1 hypothetical protein NS1R_07715 [Mammaliicoccus sciuri]KTT88014.1 hypothetical protein NS36R_11675 [Mammaliicoccus sciuri]KTT90251.1 hypothetical protein NS112_03735 [Mammaliicoccus sciuri]KTT94641.1 hypothetical protein NS44R_04445 [Mammaliicoccus sciuri]KTW13314.1 hypothetical protein RSA37_03165 [Mammaliicoccus sciuri]